MNYSDLRVLLLLLLFTTFVGIIAWVFRPNSKKHYSSMASLPLRDKSNKADNHEK